MRNETIKPKTTNKKNWNQLPIGLYCSMSDTSMTLAITCSKRIINRMEDFDIVF